MRILFIKRYEMVNEPFFVNRRAALRGGPFAILREGIYDEMISSCS
jgi:hypothetical protein